MQYITLLSGFSLPNRYTQLYCNIVEMAMSRASTKKEAKSLLGAVEQHHIVPKSFNLGGDKDPVNLVYLTPREHFLMHKLLVRMIIDPILNRKMRYALVCFTMNKSGERIIRSIDYEKARLEIKELNRMNRPWNIGRESPFKGKTHTEEIKQQISNSRKGQKTSRVYTPLSEETKQKLSDSKKGMVREQGTFERALRSMSVLGTNFSTINTGTRWYNNGIDNKRIKPEELGSYPGFILGRLVGLQTHSTDKTS